MSSTRSALALSCLVLAFGVAGCSADTDEPGEAEDSSEDAIRAGAGIIKIDLRDPIVREQMKNAEFTLRLKNKPFDGVDEDIWVEDPERLVRMTLAEVIAAGGIDVNKIVKEHNTGGVTGYKAWRLDMTPNRTRQPDARYFQLEIKDHREALPLGAYGRSHVKCTVNALEEYACFYYRSYAVRDALTLDFRHQPPQPPPGR